MAIKDNNLKLMVNLLSVSQQVLDTYFDKLDFTKLLREFTYQGNMEVVKKLLESGTDPLDCDEKGQTNLHRATMCQDDYKARKLTKLMLGKCTSEEEKKEWVTKQDDMGKTVLHVASMKGNKDFCYLLFDINEGILQIKDTDGRIDLFEEVKGGHDDLCLSLIHWKQHFNVDSIFDRSGLTLLHVAASEGRMHIADLLLERSKKPKAYVRTTDLESRQTTLHKATKGRHTNIIKVLLHWGAHPLLERDCDGRTVFHYFAPTLLSGDDRKEVAKLLLKKCRTDEKKLLLLWARHYRPTSKRFFTQNLSFTTKGAFQRGGKQFVKDNCTSG
ncbi:uncharacterized protein LOC131856811 [Cryptomeria japonica]|uniref:uncharacterized protein LOC131856811 n=1 Tax=Cryptomeria japonica TaxID=3369 RepID=UPI0027DA3150|nr:uncharacterized protein LOC131856811 [Cryptomeria japonica]